MWSTLSGFQVLLSLDRTRVADWGIAQQGTAPLHDLTALDLLFILYSAWTT